jgi:hypothetical protein
VRDLGGQRWRKKSRETFGICQWVSERKAKLFVFATTVWIFPPPPDARQAKANAAGCLPWATDAKRSDAGIAGIAALRDVGIVNPSSNDRESRHGAAQAQAVSHQGFRAAVPKFGYAQLKKPLNKD